MHRIDEPLEPPSVPGASWIAGAPAERARYSLAPPELPPIREEGLARGREPGSLLLGGKYRLEAPLAIGGMSTVWLGTHVTLGRGVAVKFIDLETHDRAQTAERFLREARLAAAIRHPNVIDVVDFGIAENGEPVMVMELLEGETLSLRMASEPRLTTHEVVHIMSQVLGALDAVHRAGILHCDMKPGNVMLGTMSDASDTFAWLIDFGIAYSIDPRSELRRGRFGTDMHIITGTPEYMAPEQAEGRTDLDERVDVYAASVMLYEMLAGSCPFTDELPGRVLFKVIEGVHVPLSVLRPDIPELAEVVRLGMSADRAARPASARLLRRLLLEASRPAASQRISRAGLPSSDGAAITSAPPSGHHLPGPEAKDRARPSPEARTLGPEARDLGLGMHEAGVGRRAGGPRRWLITLAYTLGLLAISAAVYGITATSAHPPVRMDPPPERAPEPPFPTAVVRAHEPERSIVSSPAASPPVLVEEPTRHPPQIELVEHPGF